MEPRVTDWLERLGLGQYAALFLEQGIDFSVLSDLTEADLQELGIVLGHRRKLLRAISELGAPVAASPAPSEEAPQQPQQGPERRQLTLMFCDLVGAASLAAQLDPEDMRQLVRAYHDACINVIGQYEGFGAQLLNDGALIYFGYPQAHEDDAERAVRAGLEVIAAIQQLRTPTNEPVQARIGIATGLVVVGDVTNEQAVTGTTPNLAARMQSLAGPGELVVAASTRRLLGDLFNYRSLGRLEVKGLAEPVETWVVEGVASSENRFEAFRASRLTTFVGRDQEAVQLDRCRRLAWGGEGQIVLISGEAGIGKSRLAARFSAPSAAQPFTRLRYQCSSYHTASAFYPIIEQIKRAAGLNVDDTVETQLEKLESLVAMATLEVERVAPLFAGLLSIPTGDRYPPIGIGPAQQRRQTLSALLDQLEGLARRKPVLMLFEDAQWADPSSLEVLDLMVERVRHLPVLILVTYRPDFEPPWVGLRNVRELNLGRLDPADARAMIQEVAGGKPLPEEVVEQIVAKTDGVPLFIEELTRTVLESGLLSEDTESYRLNGPLQPLAIPTTLHDSLMSRLDRLSPVKEVIQAGATIGREFTYALLQAVVGGHRDTLNAALVQLEGAQLLSRSGTPPHARYSFKHALVQDAAYESLLKSRRTILHQRIAEIVCAQFPAIAETEPEIIAHHYTQAGRTDLAIQWWKKAGEQAVNRYAFVEATDHYQRAISLSDATPDVSSPQHRLGLQIAYGQTLIALRGHGSLETTAAFARARELAEDIGDWKQLLPIYHGLWNGSFVRGDLPSMQEIAASFLRVAEDAGSDLADLGIGHRLVGTTAFTVGDLTTARSHLEQALSAALTSGGVGVRAGYGHDPGVAARIYLAIVLWQMGDVQRARDLAEEGLTLAVPSRHISTMVFGYGFKCFFEAICRDAAQALPSAEALMTVCEVHDLQSTWLGVATLVREWCHWRTGEQRTPIAEFRDTVSRYQGQGFFLYFILLRSLLAEAQESAGEYAAALATLDALESDAARTGLRWLDAELHRQRGDILRRSRPAEAEQCYRRALAIAKQQQAKAFELRAAVALAGLYRATNRAGEVPGLLAPLIRQFDDVRGLAELEEARRLVDDVIARSAATKQSP